MPYVPEDSESLLLPALVLLPGPPPDDATLRAVIRAWIDARVPEPRASALRARVGSLALHPCRASDALPMEERRMFAMWRPGVEEAALVHRARHAVWVTATGARGRLHEALALATAGARALALDRGGVVVDPITSALEPLDAQREPPPDAARASDFVKVLSTSDGEKIWATTLGLCRAGLPELELGGLPDAVLPVLVKGVQRIADALLRSIDHGGSARVVVVDGVTFELAPRGALLRVHPPGEPDGEVGPLFVELMGPAALDPPSVHVPTDDPALAAAIAQAREELPEVRRRFVAGLAPRSRLYVRAAFPCRGGGISTLVWVERFTRHQVRGRVDGNASPARLRDGQRVAVPLDRILDWRIEHPDGRVEGGRVCELVGARCAA